MVDIIQLRRDTDTNWGSEDPVLADGEPGYDKTNNQLKVGDGSTEWSALDALTPDLSAYAPLAGAAFTGQVTVAQGTITDPAPLSLTQTWNDGADTFTAMRVNVTDTASASGSLLADFQVGGTSVFRVDKANRVYLGSDADSYIGGIADGRTWDWVRDSVGVVRFGATVSFKDAIGLGVSNAVPDVYLYRDAANTLALRNGTNAQTFNIYNTYTDGSNYERGFVRFSANVFEIGAGAAGTGTQRSMNIIAAGGIIAQFGSSANHRLSFHSSFGIYPAQWDNNLDLGRSAFRFRTGHFGTSVVVGDSSIDANGTVVLANLPTSDPTVAGQLWNDSGTLKVSAG